MFKKTLVASILLVVGVAVQAQTLKVAGSILPASCALTLTNANASYGSLTAGFVSKNYPVASSATNPAASSPHYVMPLKSITYSVSCDAPAVVELAFSDTNATKFISGSVGVDSSAWGVVDGTGQAVGGMYLSYPLASPPTIDGTKTAMSTLMAPLGTAPSAWTSMGTPAHIQPGYALGWTTAAGTLPQPLTTITGYFSPVVRVKQSIVDSATSALAISAGGTITLQYL